jgi:Xaa-Pro aminopeptidase
MKETSSLILFSAILLSVAVAAADPRPVGSPPRERPTGTTPFTPEVFHARRAQLMSLMKKGVGAVTAAPREGSEEKEENLDFFYLTGIWNERDAAVLLMPENVPEEREMLLLPSARPERDRWTGYRAILPSRAVERRVGFDKIGAMGGFGGAFAIQVQQHKQLDYFGSAVPYDEELPKLLDIYQKTSQRIPGSKIEDQHLLLGRMRMVKEPREVEKIQRATDITVAGHLEAMRRVHPGMREWELKQLMEDAFRKGGARELSYPSIVGGGPDGCVLHYPEDDRTIEDGELVLIDAAAQFDHYNSDVTRTFPASGHFSPEQRKIYEVVLKAQNAALAKVRPGVTWGELQRAAEKVISDAGYYDYFIHNVGHHVGLHVHDLGPWSSREPILEGSVITIEPGIYIPEKKMGIRIEDTVLVTKSGPKLLSGALPRDPDQIEKLMNAKR